MTWKPHATVAAVIERDKQFLMVEERIDGDLVVNQPAGHLDDNENLIQAVIREVQEETAWSFKPEGIVGIYRWRHPLKHHTYMRTTFFGTVSNHDPEQILDSPIVDARWYTQSELEKCMLRSPMVLQCIRDFIAGHHYPLSILSDVQNQADC